MIPVLEHKYVRIVCKRLLVVYYARLGKHVRNAKKKTGMKVKTKSRTVIYLSIAVADHDRVKRFFRRLTAEQTRHVRASQTEGLYSIPLFPSVYFYSTNHRLFFSALFASDKYSIAKRGNSWRLDVSKTYYR